MPDTYFLGANTPLGFHSEYDTLQRDPRIRRLRILKGGSGCGKSTLMKTVAARAEAEGYRVERIPCSSDPDSLDGAVIPALGAALVDGTAPHVVEPLLCGCGANYVNLGVCYREDVLEKAAGELRELKAANAACYVPAYACLRAAGAMRDCLRSQAPTQPAPFREALLRRLREFCSAPGRGRGGVRRICLSAVTPKGLLTLPSSAARVLVLEDPFCAGGPLLKELAEGLQRDGADLILAVDPMEPEFPAGVLTGDAAILRSTPLFPVEEGQAAVDLAQGFTPADGAAEESARAALRRLRALAGQAVSHLRRAKEFHDRLEALCRPAVDFDKVDRITERLAEEIFEGR